jgi:hypothetical protein
VQGVCGGSAGGIAAAIAAGTVGAVASREVSIAAPRRSDGAFAIVTIRVGPSRIVDRRTRDHGRMQSRNRCRTNDFTVRVGPA